MTKIAVVGAGFFGSMAAIEIKKNFSNYEVDVFEKNINILYGTSGKNQFRCHKGYHYPRSIKTFIECANSLESFNKFFNKSFIKSKNFYAVSNTKSKTSFDNYIHYLDSVGLSYKLNNSKLINNNMIEGVVEVKEDIIDINQTRSIIHKLFSKYDINLFLNSKFLPNNNDKIQKYDKIIVATYENNNLFKKYLGIQREPYFYQLVEKIIVKTPKIYDQFSCVVIDGDFMSIDPYINSPYHILGHVSKSVISKKNSKSHIGKLKKYENFINSYEISINQESLFPDIKKDFKKYFNYFDHVKYSKSFYTIRCTRKNKDDERVTSIDFHDKFIFVHSGKWINCVDAAKTLVKTF